MTRILMNMVFHPNFFKFMEHPIKFLSIFIAILLLAGIIFFTALWFIFNSFTLIVMIFSSLLIILSLSVFIFYKKFKSIQNNQMSLLENMMSEDMFSIFNNVDLNSLDLNNLDLNSLDLNDNHLENS